MALRRPKLSIKIKNIDLETTFLRIQNTVRGCLEKIYCFIRNADLL